MRTPRSGAGPRTGSGSGADRGRGVRLVGLVGAVLLLAGCATMPDSGDPSAAVASSNSSQTAQQVVVVAEPPKPGDPSWQVLSGFLDDLVSDEQDYHTAKEFLTPEAAAAWKPQTQVTVLKQIHETLLPGATATKATVQVTGTVVATLNARHAYVPAENAGFSDKFVVVKGAQGWRITTPPQGIILSQVDFGRIYEPVNLYFPSARTATGAALVADPIYVRSHIDPLTEAAGTLLGGPSGWLAQAVDTAFPTGSSLGRATVRVGDETGTGSVSLRFGGTVATAMADPAVCERMAAQLFFTLSEVPTQQAQQLGQQVTSVSLYRNGDAAPACPPATAASPYSPFQAGGATGYFVDKDGALESLDVSSQSPAPKGVSQHLAPAGIGHIGGFAVEPGVEGQVAVLSQNRRELYLSALSATTSPTHASVGSAVVGGLTTPSWDGLGTLWVADTNPAAPAVHAVIDGKVLTVPVQGLHGVVTGVRAAADGARIALTVSENGGSSVQIGRIQQTGTTDAPALAIMGLLNVAPSLSTVKSVSWLDGDSVIVLGQANDGTATGLSAWEVDGSSTLAPSEQLPSPAQGMTTVVALPQDSSLQSGVSAPLLGDSIGGAVADKGKIYRWVKNQWFTLTADGDSTANGPMPSYPG